MPDGWTERAGDSVALSGSRLPIAAAVLIASTFASPASGGEEDGRTLFANGRQLRTAGKCDAAIVEFRRALDAYPEGLGSLRNIAECEEELGRFAAARRDWWDLRRAVMQTNESKYSGWDKQAEEAYSRLAAKVARVTVNLSGPRLGKVRVVLDGKPLDPRLIGVELERDLGEHDVAAFYGGAAPIAERFSLAEGARHIVTLSIPADAPGETIALAPVAPSDAAPPPDVAAPTSSGPSGMRIGGIAALGLGALGTGAMIASIVVRANALNAIESKCGADYDHCPDETAVDDADRGKTASTLAVVFGAVAVVGVGTGITLLALSSKNSSPPKASMGKRSRGERIQLRLAASAVGASAFVNGAF